MANYIDRDKLGVSECSAKFLSEDYKCAWNLLISVINNAPTADVVEVKHGKRELIPGAYRCSECHCSPTLDGSGNWALTKHCHNCGAKMDLEAKE